jgi:hypothetical protein
MFALPLLAWYIHATLLWADDFVVGKYPDDVVYNYLG